MSPLLYLFYTGLFGLMIGSCLNVVIYRLPIMLNQAGQKEYQLKRMSPPFHCQDCQKTFPLGGKIPLLGYLSLKGRCFHCKHPIPWRYPLIEFITALTSILVIQGFGWQWQSLFALILSYGLITLSAIDLDQQLLPDVLIFPLLWLGLLISTFKQHSSQDAIIGAVAGYLCLWTLAQLFKLLYKKEGMGNGDFKLLALLGAWLGWQALPAILLLAPLLGLLSNLRLLHKTAVKDYRHITIPFGPYLSFSGWILLLWGPQILNTYLSIFR